MKKLGAQIKGELMQNRNFGNDGNIDGLEYFDRFLFHLLI